MNRDLTDGHALKSILKFCIPLLIGNLFQQLYSLIDSIIVGKYLGVDAFAAIGATGSLNGLVIGFAVGLSSGLCIPIAQHFGAGNIPSLRKAAANALYISGVAGVLISILMAVFTRPILVSLNTPASILDDACAYIGTLFTGCLGVILFNLVIGFMRALGDSKTPLFYLILASVFNILLDLLFVVAFRMGVAGAAMATPLAQLLAALLCVRSIRKNLPALRLSRDDMRPSLSTIGRLSSIAVPIGLQCSITAIGSTVLQVAINGLGAQAVAALAVGSRVHGLIYPPIEAVGVGVVIFVCQNYGAKRMDRVRKGLSQITLLVIAYAILGIAITWFAGKGLAQLFVSASEADTLAQVQQFLRVTGLFFIPLNLIYVYRNALQGLGYSKLAMGSGFCETFARIGVALLAVGPLGFVGACLSAPTAWTAGGLFCFLMYFYAMGKLQRKQRQEIMGNTESANPLETAESLIPALALAQEDERNVTEP